MTDVPTLLCGLKFGIDLKSLVKRTTDAPYLYECNFIT